jgi:NADPH2:quinone reductase
MQAAYFERTGPASEIRIGELPLVELPADHVRIRVAASALNPIDLYIRAGTVTMPLNPQQIPGSDFAGEIVEVGASVTKFRVGDRVWGTNQGMFGRQGTACEIATIHEQWVYRSPIGVSDTDMSALALTGITAHLGLFDQARLKPGETVFVSGGTGGVGSMVVQIAKAAGARVITTAGTDEKRALSRELGADEALDYASTSLDDSIKAFAPEGVDVWFETQREPAFARAFPLMSKGGRFLVMAGRTATPSFPPLGQFYTRNLSVLGFAMLAYPPEPQRKAADDIVRWAATGQLKAIVGKTFSLEEAAEAHQFLEDATLGSSGKLTGKVVLEIAR